MTVFSTWIQDFDPDFYNKLLALEAASLSAFPTNPVHSQWLAEFTSLNAAYAVWQGVSRESLIPDLISGLYNVLLLGIQFGYTYDTNLGKYQSVFDMGTTRATVMAYPDSYFDDMITTPGPTYGTSPKMTALVASITAAQEATQATNVIAVSKSMAGVHVLNAMFDNPTLVVAASKDGMKQIIFDTYGYKKVYDNLNVGALTLPPGV